MASNAPNIDKQILDIEECVKGLKQEFNDNGLPINDDNTTFHRFCAKLEYLLQTEQKEKLTLLGGRKGYWDYFCKCLATKRNIHDGLKFVKSISEYRTSPGRGRAFIRFCLVNQCLADTLQQCFQNGQVTSDFYREKSSLMQFEQTTRLVSALYELNEVPFDLSPQGTNLDMGWPTFSHKVFGGATSAWNPPSRTLSMTSLFSLSSQQQDASHSFGRSFADEDSVTESHATSDIENAIHGIVAKIDELNANQCETNELTKELALNAGRHMASPRCDFPTSATIDGAADGAAWWENREADLRSRLDGMERAAADHAHQLETVSAQHDERERERSLQVAALQQRNEELSELVRGLQSGRPETEKKASDASDNVEGDSAGERKAEADGASAAVVEPMDEGREAKYKKAVAALLEKLACKERVNGHLERQVAALKEVASAVKSMMEVRTSEVHSLRKIVDELKTVQGASAPSAAVPPPQLSQEEKNRLEVLESERAVLEEQTRELQQNVENVRRDLDAATEQLRQRETEASVLRDRITILEAEATESQQLAAQSAERLNASEADRVVLSGRLEVLEELLRRVEVAELELERREEAAAASVGCRDEVDDLSADDGAVGGASSTSGQGGRPRPLGSDGEESSEAHSGHDSVVHFALTTDQFAGAHRALARLEKWRPHFCPEYHQHAGSKLQSVTSELRATKSLVDQLKNAHKRLQTSDAILRYELREKRVFVERMKQQLESASNMRMRVRQKHSESELEWQSLRAEFASRRQQDSDESGVASADLAIAPTISTIDSSTVTTITTATSSNTTPSEATTEMANEVLVSEATASRDKSEERESVDGASCSSEASSSSCYVATHHSSASPDLPAVGAEAASETEEDERPPSQHRRRADVRLELMEEQCRLLYCSLLSSMKKSERLHWKLSKLHDNHSGSGPRAEGTATPSTEREKTVDSTSPLANVDPNTDDDDSCSREAAIAETTTTTNNTTDPEIAECTDETGSGALGLDEVDVLDSDRDTDALHIIDEVVIDEGKLVAKLDTLLVAQSLAKRVEVLKRKKQGLECDVARMVEDRDEGLTREAHLLSRLQEAGATVARLESLVADRDELERQKDLAEKLLREAEARLCDERSGLEQEVTALRFRMSTEALLHDAVAQRHSNCEAEMAETRERVAERERVIGELETRLDAVSAEAVRQREVDEALIGELRIRAASAEEECGLMCEQLRNATRQLDESRGATERVTASLDESRRERERLRDEMDELRTLTDDMREKIIQLIKDKDTLWRRGERLSFIQRLQSSDRWHQDQEVSHCMNCNAEFSIVLRKHHCRICGRIFCFGCCNHWATTAAHSGRVRVCDECVVGHTATASLDDESDGDDNDAILASGGSSSLQIQRSTGDCFSADINRGEDISPSHSSIMHASTCSSESTGGDNDERSSVASGASGSGSLLGRLLASWSTPKSRTTSTTAQADDEFHVIGDEEILKSLSHSSPYTDRPLTEGETDAGSIVHLCPLKNVAEIETEFADGMPREVWINAGKVYGVPVIVSTRLTLRWEFSTEPKSIAFSLVYHEGDCASSAASASSVAARLGTSPTRVLVPVTHCDSHLRTVHGKLTARNSGIYTFYFGNDFSRFTAKKLKFIARIEKNVVATTISPDNKDDSSSSLEPQVPNETSG